MMEEPEYVIEIIETGGALISDKHCKNVPRKLINGGLIKMQAKFQNTKLFD